MHGMNFLERLLMWVFANSAEILGGLTGCGIAILLIYGWVKWKSMSSLKKSALKSKQDTSTNVLEG